YSATKVKFYSSIFAFKEDEAGIDEWTEEFVRHWDAASFKSRNSSPRPDLSPSLSLEPAPSPVYNSVDEEIATLVHRSSQMSNALDVLTEKTDEFTRYLEELHKVVVTSATTINTMEDSMDLLFTNVEKLLELFSDFQEENRVELWSRLEPPLCARSSLCSVSTQCWRSSPCTDDSLQLSPSFGVFRVGVRFRSSGGSVSQRGTLPLGHELGPGSGGILACTLEGGEPREIVVSLLPWCKTGEAISYVHVLSN
ncbi:hypothetical protein DNTS_029021, partial [Danionella cerebrum]